MVESDSRVTPLASPFTAKSDRPLVVMAGTSSSDAIEPSVT